MTATEQPIDQPADAGTDQHASNEFAREPKAPGVTRCSRRPICASIFGRRSLTLARGAQAFAETLEPRGEGGFVGVRLVAFAVFARAVTHLSDTRGLRQSRRTRPQKPRGPY